MYRQRRENSDVISNLPENITESILARLPIRDVVRTSILSRNWRYQWTTLPDLVFDAKGADEDKLVKVIYRILWQHKGPINKFALRSMRSYPDIDQWVNFLSRNGVREFILEFDGGNWYKTHSRLFYCVNLRRLSLRCCTIPSPPPTFNGFNDLTCLNLDRVSVNNEGFENLIAKCPKLKVLQMNKLDGLDGLNIDYAPKLKTLGFVGSLKNICLKNTPSLSYAFLAEGSVRKLLPSTFKNLLHVRFPALMFEDIDSLSSVLGLITSSPNLERLSVLACRTTNSAAGQILKTVAEYLEGESCSIGYLMKLRHVEMKDIVGVGPEMELIKLILGKSPSLEQMKIEPNETVHGFRERESKILKDLVRFPRASKIAEIIYQGQDHI